MLHRTPGALTRRVALLDQARGVAILAMVIYHALWDGLLFGLITWSPERDAAMRIAAQLIATSFLVIVGLSMALTDAKSEQVVWRTRPFWRRFAAIAAGAALVSLGTFFALPQAPIYFGILHHIALASVILALVLPWHPFFMVAGAALIVIANDRVALEALNAPATIWLGFGTRAPVTADWVPLVPWLAAGLIGLAIGKQWVLPWLKNRPSLGSANPRDALAFAGRHSLIIYLAHQPILIGIIQLYLIVME